MNLRSRGPLSLVQLFLNFKLEPVTIADRAALKAAVRMSGPGAIEASNLLSKTWTLLLLEAPLVGQRQLTSNQCLMTCAS